MSQEATGLSKTLIKLDLVQLCETQMFKFVLYGNVIFDILEQSSFQKYTS